MLKNDRYNEESRFLDFLVAKLGTACVLATDVSSHAKLCEQLSEINVCSDDANVIDFISNASGSIEVVGKQIYVLDQQRWLMACSTDAVPGGRRCLLTTLPGSFETAKQLIEVVIESYQLHAEVNSCRAALDESAMQLAQSFEEQNWLRGFARSATSFTKSSSANDMAGGILKPLGYLLRAQDVFLLVDPSETVRSGLSAAKYGDSAFSVDSISSLLQRLGVNTNSAPLVRNHAELDTPDGMVHSIVAVAVKGMHTSIGHLVGINRSTETHVGGLPVYDPEFGSGDVGLLEEAAVLLSTQAHNIHLLVQSNQLFLGSLHAMSSAIDARDPYTQGHSERVARLAFDLAELMQLSDAACQEIYLAGILHDIGKIGIPDAVLLKNGSLSDEEFRVIQRHPEIGYRIVERLGHLQFVLPGILHHHERWDGRGYPHGLAGQSIPLMARILAVADAFDAMTSSRPYRNAMPLSRAYDIISSDEGIQWDADVVDCFRKWIDSHYSDFDTLPLDVKSIIPEGSPMEHIVHAVMALGL